MSNSGDAASSVLVLTGARGLGKTVTLDVIAESARDRGFVTAAARFDAVSDNVQILAARVAEAVAPLSGRGGERWARLRQGLAGISVELNAGVVRVISAPGGVREEPAGAVQRTVLTDLLVSAARIAVDGGNRGLVVLVDEVQEAPHHDLVVFTNSLQDVLTDRKDELVPLGVFAAGLPETPERVMAAASFAERFDFRALGRLDDDAAERALIEPALDAGVRWHLAAARTVLDAAAGSPYLLQRLGHEAWLLADPQSGDIILEQHAADAVVDIREHLAGGMFRGRWEKATPMERMLMVAIAQVVDHDGIAQSRHITAATGRSTSQLSMVRRALIDRGVIESTGTGRLRFTMPGFSEFVRSQVDAPWLWAHVEAGRPLPLDAPTADPGQDTTP